ncbi:MAG: hypothetical protein WCK01_03095 [Candidatus Uhrbacteria bacterium]
MFLSKKKILKAMQIAAGDDREALELVQYIEEYGVHVAPHRDIPGDWDAPSAEFVAGKMPMFCYNTHRDFLKKHGDTPWISDIEEVKLVCEGKAETYHTLNVSPVPCRDEWRGLSLLSCVATIKWNMDGLEPFLTPAPPVRILPRRHEEMFNQAKMELVHLMVRKNYQRLVGMIERLILRNSQLILGTDTPPPRLVDPVSLERDRQTERALAQHGTSIEAAIALFMATVTLQHRKALSEREKMLRCEMFQAIVDEAERERLAAINKVKNTTFPIGSC